jgi:hypothetical protein
MTVADSRFSSACAMMRAVRSVEAPGAFGIDQRDLASRPLARLGDGRRGHGHGGQGGAALQHGSTIHVSSFPVFHSG